MEQMYQEVILDHYKHPHHRGLREPFGAEVYHVNPTCGDEVTLRVALSDDGEQVVDVSYDGQGCSISQAATSVLTDLVTGQSVGDALKTVVRDTGTHDVLAGVSGDGETVVLARTPTGYRLDLDEEQVEPHDHGLLYGPWWNLERWVPTTP